MTHGPSLPPTARRARLALRVLLTFPLLAFPARIVSAHPTHPGKWTGTINLGGTAVNLNLVPGWSPTYHSRVVWWNHDSDDPVSGNVLGWNPPDDDSTNGGAFPTSKFTSLVLQDPPWLHGKPANLFCSAASLLADGRMFVVGGTHVGESGSVSAMFFDPSADVNGEWSRTDDLAFRRWYPDITVLPNGRALVASGSSYAHYLTLGGFADAAPDTQTRLLQRVGVAVPSTVEPSVVPLHATTGLPIDLLSDATGLHVSSNRMLAYGGRRGINSDLSEKAYLIGRDHNEFGPDYDFRWTEAAQSAPLGQLPEARVGATLITILDQTDVLLIGGNQLGGPSSRVWRGTLSGNTIFWRELFNQSGTSLPALHGHGAVYDRTARRVFVFGGSGTASETPTNASVYSLAVSDTISNTWMWVNAVTVSGPNIPNPRGYGSFTHIPYATRGIPGLHPDTSRMRALLFGGRTSTGGYSDSLHAMWIKSATEVIWEGVVLDAESPRPSARAKHSASLDPNSLSLVVSGGETASGTGSTDVWTHGVLCGQNKRCNESENQLWVEQPPLPLPLRGHASAVIATESAFARFPELMDPAMPAPEWTTLTAVPHWQEWFPFGFTAPRRSSDPVGTDSIRVFYAGPEVGSPTLHLSRSPMRWTPMTSGTANFKAGAAVMYRPGKVMKSGTRDTGGINASDVFGRTAVIDLNAPTPAWTEAAPANQMISRRNHNLVILPTGEVIVVGGARFGDNDFSADANVVRMPQIWNPDTLAAGHWYGTNAAEFKFDSSSVRRHYHTSAVLTPDGRVLVAGGNADPLHQTKADLYSPYYLFNTDGTPAARPQIQRAPAAVAYGERFPLCISASGPALAKLSLVRPGATTHGFDQNQRFLPLTVEAAPPGAGTRFLVSAPADSFDAPPGDYMMFALTSAGTPSIAHWIRLRATNGQSGHPTAINNLAKICSQGSTVQLQWTPPAGDSASAAACPGPAALYELKYRQGTISDWDEFASATSATGMPLPNDPVPGQPQSISVSGLTPNTQYTFRIISKNSASGNGNWSALGNALTFTTIDEECGGSGGGGGGCCHEGSSARQARGLWSRRPNGGSGSDFLENTLFTNPSLDVPATDLLRLPYGPKWTQNAAQIRLSRAGISGTRFTRVRLLSVAVPEGQDAFTAGDRILIGSLRAASAIRHADGRDLSLEVGTESGFAGSAGDTLEVNFSEAAPGRIALETSDAELVAPPRRSGIDIQCLTPQGWTTVDHHDPRERRSDALHEVPLAGRLRLVFLGDHRLHGVAWFVPGESPVITSYEPTSLTHSVAGELVSTLGADGARVAPGESMVASFALAPPADASLEWFLDVGGNHTAVATSGGYSQQGGPHADQPLRFALAQNRPNPFESNTEIGFELPRRATVRLEVFDLLGRRVAVLVNAPYEAGRHSVTWDRRGNRGTRLPAGVYTCRYSADGHQELKRMVVFP